MSTKPTNVLIIGAGSAAQMVVSEIINNQQLRSHYRIVGLLDDVVTGDVKGCKILGKIADCKKVTLRDSIDEIIIAIPSAKKDSLDLILSHIAGLPAKIKIVPGIFEIIAGDVSFTQIREIEAIDLLGREEVGFEIEELTPFYKSKTIFVTGAGGSIGGELTRQLLRLPIKSLIAFGHGENSIHELKSQIDDPRFRFIIGDIRDYSKLAHEMILHKPNIVFHAAAHKHVPLMELFPDEAIKNNIFGTQNVALAAIGAGVKDFLLVSTDKAVNPTSVMGATKRIAEIMVLGLNASQHNTRFCLTRFGNVLGARGSVFHTFKEQIKKGGPITITHPEIERYFMSIGEAARLLIKACASKEGLAYVLDMGKPIKIVDLVNDFLKISGLLEKNIPIVFTGLRKGEKLYEELFINEKKYRVAHFNKLFVSDDEGSFLTADEINSLVDELKEAVGSYDALKMKAVLKKYVPEYKYEA